LTGAGSADSSLAPLLALCLFPPNDNVVCFFGAWLPSELEPKNFLRGNEGC
jgi:hypothetical protein